MIGRTILKSYSMIPMRQSCPILGPIVGLDNKVLEISLWKKTGNLNANVLSDMHKYPKFDLRAEVRISKLQQGFCGLLCYA